MIIYVILGKNSLGGVFGLSWAVLRRPQDVLEAAARRLGGVFELYWAVLRRPQDHWRRFWAVLGRLDLSCGGRKTSWRRLSKPGIEMYA